MKRNGRTMEYHLGLGSNLGNRIFHLETALRLLKPEKMRFIRLSPVYQTTPLDNPRQPLFLNGAVLVESGRSPESLLRLLQDIEKRMGRTRMENKGPRTIDIDILFTERRVIQTDDLIIPHPRLHLRNFVLKPLLDIDPDFVHPVLKKTIRRLYSDGCGRGAVTLWGEDWNP